MQRQLNRILAVALGVTIGFVLFSSSRAKVDTFAELPPDVQSSIRAALVRDRVLPTETFVERTFLTPSQGRFTDEAGWSVAIAGDTVVVGVHWADVGGNIDRGAAYIFIEPPGGWDNNLVENAKLTASNGSQYDEFGFSVAISGDTVVVGARNDNLGSGGSAYVFLKPDGGWSGTITEDAKLTASDGNTTDRFGVEVAVADDTIVVGAPDKRVNGNPRQGATYVFVKPPGGWSGTHTENAKLTASDGDLDDYFGVNHATTGDVIVIGNYVFVKPIGGWSGNLNESARLMATAGVGVGLGYSVSISQDTIALGASHSDSAYVFLKPVGGWNGTINESARLVGSDTWAFDNFASSIAIESNTVVVGDPSNSVNESPYQGAAYVYVEPPGGWSGILTESAKLVAAAGAEGDRFAFSLAMSNNTIVAGALWDDVNYENQGAAYVFSKDLPVIQVSPSSITENHDPAPQITTQTVTIGNQGVAPMTFNIAEEGDSPLMGGALAYGVNTSADTLVNFELESPTILNTIINNVNERFYAGDFANNDFSTLYALDDFYHELVAINTTTGELTLIGSSVPPGGVSATWTGMSWDDTTNTMYVVSADCDDSSISILSTIDLATGALTPVGPVINGMCLINLAASPDGQLYGVEITNDVLLSIDKDTATVTVIGPIGFNASFAQGADFDDATGTLYLAAYNAAISRGELRTVNLTTGATTRIGPLGPPPTQNEIDSFAIGRAGICAHADDIAWLTVDQNNGIVAPGESTDVTITFDSLHLPVGTYTATLCVKSNDPLTPLVLVPLTLNVPLVLPTPTATQTQTVTPTFTPTGTAVTPTQTVTPTFTPTETAVTPTQTVTPTFPPTGTLVPPNGTPTPTGTVEPPTSTPTTPTIPTFTPTVTFNPSTNTPTITPIGTITPPPNRLYLPMVQRR